MLAWTFISPSNADRPFVFGWTVRKLGKQNLRVAFFYGKVLHPPILFREISAKNVTIVSISNKLPLWQINHNLERNSVLSVFLCQDMPKLSNHSGLHFNCPLSDDRISFLFIFTTFQLILRIWGSQICLKTRTSLSQDCPYQSLSMKNQVFSELLKWLPIMTSIQMKWVFLWWKEFDDGHLKHVMISKRNFCKRFMSINYWHSFPIIIGGQ